MGDTGSRLFSWFGYVTNESWQSLRRRESRWQVLFCSQRRCLRKILYRLTLNQSLPLKSTYASLVICIRWGARRMELRAAVGSAAVSGFRSSGSVVPGCESQARTLAAGESVWQSGSVPYRQHRSEYRQAGMDALVGQRQYFRGLAAIGRRQTAGAIRVRALRAGK